MSDTVPKCWEVTAIIKKEQTSFDSVEQSGGDTPSSFRLSVCEFERYSGVWLGEQMMGFLLLQSWLYGWGGLG